MPHHAFVLNVIYVLDRDTFCPVFLAVKLTCLNVAMTIDLFAGLLSCALSFVPLSFQLIMTIHLGLDSSCIRLVTNFKL